MRTPFNADFLCDYLSEGPDDGMAGACRHLGVSTVAIYAWIRADAEFAERMEGARRDGLEAIMERTRLVARGVKGYSSGDPKRDKLIIDQDNKLASKWHPKRYGDKLEVEQTNRNANLDIPADMNVEDAARMYHDWIKQG